jgi:lipopolysaccharide transport system permease protein
MSILSDLRALPRYYELLYILTWRDISVRYKQSVMGILWAILMPLLIVGSGVLVRVAMGKLTGSTVTIDDMASVTARALLWSFVVSAIRFATATLVSNSNLVTKIAFPREVLPFAAVLSSLADFLVALVFSTLLLLVLGWLPSVHALWSAFVIVDTVVLIAGLGLLLSAANLYYRDVRYIVEVFLTFGIFYAPVLYDSHMLGEWRVWILLNPVSPLLEAFSDVLVKHVAPDPRWLTYSTVAAIVTFLLGYSFFKRLEGQFAERI